MLDRTHAGVRCHTRRMLRTVEGNLPRESAGTVMYELENLGRRLIVVSWDTGVTVPVFPDEVELQPQHNAPLITAITGATQDESMPPATSLLP